MTVLDGDKENPLLDSRFPDVSGKGRGYQIQTLKAGLPEWPELRKVSIWQTVGALEEVLLCFPFLPLEILSLSMLSTPLLSTAMLTFPFSCDALLCPPLRYSPLCCTALRNASLHCTAVHDASLHCTSLRSATLHSISHYLHA